MQTSLELRLSFILELAKILLATGFKKKFNKYQNFYVIVWSLFLRQITPVKLGNLPREWRPWERRAER